MAYDPKNLSVLCYANGFTLWHYTTTDTISEVNSAGYFNGASMMVRIGDMFMANIDTDGNGICARIFLVKDNVGGAVDVARLAFTEGDAGMTDATTENLEARLDAVAADRKLLEAEIEGYLDDTDALKAVNQRIVKDRAALLNALKKARERLKSVCLDCYGEYHDSNGLDAAIAAAEGSRS